MKRYRPSMGQRLRHPHEGAAKHRVPMVVDTEAEWVARLTVLDEATTKLLGDGEAQLGRKVGEFAAWLRVQLDDWRRS